MATNITNHQTLQDIIGDQDREERIKKLDMVIERLLLENRDSTLHVLTSTGDEQYPEQIVPLLDVLDREQIRNRHDICFQERMKSHNDVANRLKDFINIRLLQILYGCEVRTEQNIQTVSRDNRDSESYQVIYRYEKRDGTVEQHVLDNGCCSVPVDQIWYSEILVLKDGQEIWSFSLSEWLEDTVSVSFQQAETGWDIDFMPNDTCPPNMTFNFQIHDQKGTRLYTQSYSRETHYHVDLQLDKGYYHYILRYKKYAFVSPKLAYQKTDC